MEWLRRLEELPFLHWVRLSEWGYHLLLAAHAIGMAIIVGVAMMFAARLLGHSPFYRLHGFRPFFILAGLGFLMNAASGAILFLAQGRRMIMTPAFQVKMALIVLAGLSIAYLMSHLRAAGEGNASLQTKIAAALPVILWIGVIIAGRLIGYTIAPPL